ncbi:MULTISPECIES: hypothetical protein [unclassified Siphonobacter]|uniref:hypothetical protein n=1 Tax=unclassified Siphonobacter TaxID=2635712 RepID=UPI0012FEB9D2|nr:MULTISPECIES: hypothetical protein [unclassified Siphonobacter]MDQ1088190.1 hypothetical protein [Siphonobacter sp. SORGH_AS_1065]MDR6194336.1 hypothetical protein [Siphonobacter sp. SORGH_AS_0500]
MTGIFIIGGVALLSGYVIYMVWLVSKMQGKCECKSCKTSIHIERINRPEHVKKLAGFIPLKYYRCRHCSGTFFLRESTPDNEPVKMEISRKRRRSSREAELA